MRTSTRAGPPHAQRRGQPPMPLRGGETPMSGHWRLAEQVRTASRAFVEQAGSNPHFLRGYHADPVGVLRALGMPEIAIADALRETGYAELEVTGFITNV